MEFKKAMNVLMAQEGISQKKWTEEAGYKTVSAISTPMSKGDIMLSTLCRLAKSVGYSVCLVKDGPNEEGYLPIPVDAKSVKGAEKKGS